MNMSATVQQCTTQNDVKTSASTTITTTITPNTTSSTIIIPPPPPPSLLTYHVRITNNRQTTKQWRSAFSGIMSM
jgi:hypothetical protein